MSVDVKRALSAEIRAANSVDCFVELKFEFNLFFEFKFAQHFCWFKFESSENLPSSFEFKKKGLS